MSGARTQPHGSKTCKDMKESSTIKTINAPIERVYATLANLENLRPLLEENKDKLRDVVLTNDSIEVTAGMVGTISFRIEEREDCKCVKFVTDRSPVKAKVWIQVLPENAGVTKMKLTAEADIPMMLRPMVGSRMKDAVEKVADMITMIKY